MTSAPSRITSAPSRMTSAPSRVLIAVHGFEPATWVGETVRSLSMWPTPAVRVLALVSAPAPPFTSLTPMASRAYGSARTAWIAHERAGIQRVIDDLVAHLATAPEIVWLSGRRDLAPTIAAQAAAYDADVLVLGVPLSGLRTWLWPGPIYDAVVRRAPCPVLVIPARPARIRPVPSETASPAWRSAWPAERRA